MRQTAERDSTTRARKNNDLEDVKRIPLTPPKVDSATKRGTIHAQFPYNSLAKVTPTASAPRTSATDKVEWKAMIVSEYTTVQRMHDAMMAIGRFLLN